MDFRTFSIAKKFRNNNYFTDLEDYIYERVKENKLSYNDLKYLYKNLYRGHSLYVKQNIYPVGEFLSKGFSTAEAEKIAKLLPDAKKYTVFCYDEKECGYTYNKLFRDLQYAYFKYERIYNNCKSEDETFEKVKRLIEKTDVKARGDFMEKFENREKVKENEEELELE